MPVTNGTPASAQRSAKATVASGRVTSMITSTGGSSVIERPVGTRHAASNRYVGIIRGSRDDLPAEASCYSGNADANGHAASASRPVHSASTDSRMARFPADIGVSGRRTSPEQIPSIPAAVLTAIGLLSRNIARQSGKNRRCSSRARCELAGKRRRR